MRIYTARANNRFLGLFRYLFILGVGRGTNGASDFTDADTSQDFTLLTPEAGDVMLAPSAVGFTKIAFVAPSLTAVTVTAGISAGGTEILPSNATMLTKAGTSGTSGIALPPDASASAPAGVIVFNGSTNLISVRVATTGANLNAITAGELWIYANLLPLSEIVDTVDA